MTNKELMHKALRSSTIPKLLALGFTGKYPHFRRTREDCIELLSFQTNQWGGSFTVEVSAVFPGTAKPNFQLHDSVTMETLTVFSTNRRYRLPGMYDRWFHYWDLYRKRTLFWGTQYHAVPESEAASFIPSKGYRLFQAFDAAQADRVCREVEHQLEDAWIWLEQFRKEHSGS